MRKHLSISRESLKRNRDVGSRLPVIRVVEGDEVTHGSHVEIAGPSRVVYSPGNPRPEGAEIWIETDAAVTLDQAPTPPRPSPRRSSDLSRVLDSGLLDGAARALAAAVEAEPGRIENLRRLAETLRQAGRRHEAAAAYREILSRLPADGRAARLAAALSGQPLPEAPAPWPARFALVEHYLEDERVDEIRELVTRKKEDFLPTPVLQDGKNALRPDIRAAENIWNIEPVRSWFEDDLRKRLPGLMAALGDTPFTAEIKDPKITRYSSGGFAMHVDRGPGAADRVYGFIYYFFFPPRRFEGGALAIYDRDVETGHAASTCTTLFPDHNQLVLLPSDCWHEVTRVRCTTPEWDAGRFTLNGWVTRRRS